MAPPEMLAPAERLASGLSARLGRRPARVIDGGRRAAVLIVLFDRERRPHTLLTKRAEHLTVHSGQISLPGGAREPEDGSLWETALRETEEEVGVPRERVAFVGQLDDVETMVSGFVVTPFVGLLEEAPVTRCEVAEVARIIEAPLDELLDADARLPERPSIATLRYPLFGEDIWGATARILTTFIAQLHAAGTSAREPTSSREPEAS